MCCFTEFFKKNVDVQDNPPAQFSRNERLLITASKEIGVLEVKGSGSNPKVELYHAFAREDNDPNKGLRDDVPWCASFICYCLENSGMGSTNSMLAKSFLKWGVSKKKSPLPGDLVVYDRGGYKGHVGLYLQHDSKYIWTLGGNQSDSVRVSKYTFDNFLDFRRSSIQDKKGFTTAQVDNLKRIANEIIKGNAVELASSMS